MSFNRPIIGIALLALLSQACRQDEERFIIERREILSDKDSIWHTVTALNDTALTINKFFKDLALKPEAKNVDISSGGYYSFSNGCNILLPANSCVVNGVTASGTAQMEVILIRSRGEMVAHRMETVSNGKLLESGGQIFVKITQNGREVALRSGATISINFSTSQRPNGTMQLFYGEERANGSVNWVTAADSNRVWARADSFQNILYNLTFDRLRWINCDYFRDSANLVKFCVQLPDSFNNVNTHVFAVFRQINAMVMLQGDSASRRFCVPSFYRGLPAGDPITLVAIARMGRDSATARYYLGTSDVTITANMTYPLTPVRKTIQEIRAFLGSL